jgi:hypothetical protein
VGGSPARRCTLTAKAEDDVQVIAELGSNTLSHGPATENRIVAGHPELNALSVDPPFSLPCPCLASHLLKKKVVNS